MEFSSILTQYHIQMFIVQTGKNTNARVQTQMKTMSTSRFLLLESDSMYFETENMLLELQPGDILYTPAFLKYRVQAPYGTIFTNAFFHMTPYSSKVDDNESPFPDPIMFHDRPDMAEIIRRLLKEEKEHRSAYQLMQESMLRQLLIELYRELSAAEREKQRSVSESILHYINDHCEERISRETLLREFHYHPNYINNLIIRATGKTFHQYLIDARIRRAKKMLSETNLPITEIALKLCFYDSSHFSAVFVKKTGMTPSDFRSHF